MPYYTYDEYRRLVGWWQAGVRAACVCKCTHVVTLLVNATKNRKRISIIRVHFVLIIHLSFRLTSWRWLSDGFDDGFDALDRTQNFPSHFHQRHQLTVSHQRLKRLLQVRFDFDWTTTKNKHVHFFVASRGVVGLLVANKKAVDRTYNDGGKWGEYEHLKQPNDYCSDT